MTHLRFSWSPSPVTRRAALASADAERIIVTNAGGQVVADAQIPVAGIAALTALKTVSMVRRPHGNHPEKVGSDIHDLVRLVAAGGARTVAADLTDMDRDLAKWVGDQIERSFGPDLRYTLLRLRTNDRSPGAQALDDDAIARYGDPGRGAAGTGQPKNKVTDDRRHGGDVPRSLHPLAIPSRSSCSRGPSDPELLVERCEDGPLMRGLVRLVQRQVELAVEGPEQHAVTAVVSPDRLLVVAPRPVQRPGRRTGNPCRVTTVTEAGPQHDQLTAGRAMQEGAVGDEVRWWSV